MKKNRIQKALLVCAFVAMSGARSFALGTADFATAISTSTTLAQELSNIFFLVVPLALVIGLSIWGYRMARKLAR